MLNLASELMARLPADHVTATNTGEVLMFLAVPLAWVAGVVLFVAFKFRTH